MGNFFSSTSPKPEPPNIPKMLYLRKQQQENKRRKEQAKDHRSPKLKLLEKEIEMLEELAKSSTLTQQEKYDLEDKKKQAEQARKRRSQELNDSMMFPIELPLWGVLLRF